MLGKSIRVYLKEGSVTGIKFAELVNQTIQAFSCPRNKLSELNVFFEKEVNTQGVYFLLGYDEKTLDSKVYIGEAENVWGRLKNHDLKKHFWNEVIIFTSKDENLTKAHIKYLESRLVEISKETERYSVGNLNKPTLSSLPLPDRDAMEEFLLNIKLLTGTLGHKFLESNLLEKSVIKNLSNSIDLKNNEEITEFKKEKVLYLNISGIKAQGIQTDEGIVVLKDSEVSSNSTKNYGYGTLREKLISNEVINKKEGEGLFFIKNHLFTSTSAAAGVIVGYSINGRNVWKNNEGKSINEIEKNNLKNGFID